MARQLCTIFWTQSLAKGGEGRPAASTTSCGSPSPTDMVFLKGDFEKDETYKQLADCLAEIDKKKDLGGNVLFYMAVADRFFGTIAGKLGEAGLVKQKEGRFRRLIVEKPFGHDLESAKALNACLLKYLKEDQIYRIDHFLGKETVQNIMALRFANGLFEPIWNRDRIDHVQITVAESIGIEGRGNFYEKTGALARHGAQSPVPAGRDDGDGAAGLLRRRGYPRQEGGDVQAPCIRSPWAMWCAANMIPAWSAASRWPPIARRRMSRPIPMSRPSSRCGVMIDNWRWAGVPFYLRTGKRLATRSTEIAIRFKRAPYALFRETPMEELDADWLILRVQPDESIRLRFNAKRPGPAMALESVAMEFKYKDWFQQAPAVGYETLIYDCLIGDATLFQRADQVEAAWGVVEPVLHGWANSAPRAFSQLRRRQRRPQRRQ